MSETLGNIIGYGRWLLERGEITQAEFDSGVEAARQEEADQIADELLRCVDLTGLAGNGCDGWK